MGNHLNKQYMEVEANQRTRNTSKPAQTVLKKAVFSATPQHSNTGNWGWCGFSSSVNNSLSFQLRDLILVIKDPPQKAFGKKSDAP